MPPWKVNRFQLGTSLVEVLLYMAIFSVVLGSIATIWSALGQTRNKVTVIGEVEAQGSFLVKYIAQTIRNSISVNSPGAASSAASLSLVMPSAPVSPTVFQLNSGVVTVTEGVNSPVNLSNNKVSVSNLTFENRAVSGAPGSIRFSFTVSAVGSTTRGQDKYSVVFYGSSSERY